MYQKNIWKDADATKTEKITAFCEDYKKFLSYAKTERLAVEETERIAREHGFNKFDEVKEIKAGEKIYFINKNIIF